MGKGKSGHKPNDNMRRKRAVYKMEGRRIRNKIRRLKKTLSNHPNDRCAQEALKRTLHALD